MTCVNYLKLPDYTCALFVCLRCELSLIRLAQLEKSSKRESRRPFKKEQEDSTSVSRFSG